MGAIGHLPALVARNSRSLCRRVYLGSPPVRNEASGAKKLIGNLLPVAVLPLASERLNPGTPTGRQAISCTPVLEASWQYVKLESAAVARLSESKDVFTGWNRLPLQ